MDASANLSLPATTKMLCVLLVSYTYADAGVVRANPPVRVDVRRTLVNCKLAYIPDEVRALTGLEQLCVCHLLSSPPVMHRQPV